MEAENSLLLEVEAYVSNFISEQVPNEFAFHDIQHTLNVVEAVKEIGQYLEFCLGGPRLGYPWIQ